MPGGAGLPPEDGAGQRRFPLRRAFAPVAGGGDRVEPVRLRLHTLYGLAVLKRR
jgi:hypothetical protein